ncbi:MAG: hypothetical protein JST59_19450, partial [Actinobacteria bacterium]|nr:hypothetical protein [Actinomycetota bacterium]
TITSSSINESTLGTVPSAQTATTAATATKANSATKSATATSAESAKHAETAKQAESAKHAETADSAKHAETADSANRAGSAGTADRATIAGDAEKLGGQTPEELKAELEVRCATGTEFYGGMCWDESVRPAKFWLAAVKECGEAGGRLPSIEELIAYILQPGVQVTGQTWSADLDTLEAGEEAVFTSDETSRSTKKGIELGYRCVFPQSN